MRMGFGFIVFCLLFKAICLYAYAIVNGKQCLLLRLDIYVYSYLKI